MAGTVEHLAIALELMERWKDKKETGVECEESVADGNVVQKIRLRHPELFLAGNVCPDGIQARHHYQRSMKMHTHFRDGIPDYAFGDTGNLSLFHQRIHQFANRHLSRASSDRELYLGYLTHILADEIFMLTVRPEFMKKISVLGLTDRDAETFEHFTFDVNQIDFRLAREYPGMETAYGILKNSKPYSIDGMITEEELTRSREWILDFFFHHAPEPQQPIYYTYERALQFIREAVDIIEVRIREYI